MLNPSTADALEDDATIRALIRLLKAQGRGGFEVVNLFAFRATDPRELAAAVVRRVAVIGPMNNMYIVATISRCDTVICAWGAHKLVVQSMRGVGVLDLIKDKTPMCFGTTKAGAPRHPLYLKTGTELEPYNA